MLNFDVTDFWNLNFHIICWFQGKFQSPFVVLDSFCLHFVNKLAIIFQKMFLITSAICSCMCKLFQFCKSFNSNHQRVKTRQILPKLKITVLQIYKLSHFTPESSIKQTKSASLPNRPYISATTLISSYSKLLFLSIMYYVVAFVLYFVPYCTFIVYPNRILSHPFQRDTLFLCDKSF